MGKSCEQLTDHCRHVIVVVKWLLISHSSSSHVYSSEDKWGLVLYFWVDYNSSFFSWEKKLAIADYSFYALSCTFILEPLSPEETTLSTRCLWAGGPSFEGSELGRSLTWMNAELQDFVLLAHTKPVLISLSVLFFVFTWDCSTFLP